MTVPPRPGRARRPRPACSPPPAGGPGATHPPPPGTASSWAGTSGQRRSPQRGRTSGPALAGDHSQPRTRLTPPRTGWDSPGARSTDREEGAPIAEIEVGAVVEGTVQRITPYG